jgi:hypothetical protein
MASNVGECLARLHSVLNMTAEEISKLTAYRWMQSRIPLLDALTTFVADAPEPEPVIAEMSNRFSESVWYPVAGGHRVLFRYDGGPFDSSRFTLEPKVWDYNECSLCGAHIAAMTLCYVTEPQQHYILLCAACYERNVGEKIPKK